MRVWVLILALLLSSGAQAQQSCESIFVTSPGAVRSIDWQRLADLEKELEAVLPSGQLEEWRMATTRKAVETLASILVAHGLQPGRDFDLRFETETLESAMRERAAIGISADRAATDLRLPYILIYSTERAPAILRAAMRRMNGSVEAIAYHPMYMRLLGAYGMFQPTERRVYLRASSLRSLIEQGRLDGTTDHEFHHALLRGRRVTGKPSIFDIGFRATPHHSRLPGEGYQFYLASEELMTFLRSNLRDADVDVYTRLRHRPPQLKSLLALFQSAVLEMSRGQGRQDFFPTVSVEREADGTFEVQVTEKAEAGRGPHPKRKILFWVHSGHPAWAAVQAMYDLQTEIEQVAATLPRERGLSVEKVSHLELAFIYRHFLKEAGGEAMFGPQIVEAFKSSGLSALMARLDLTAGQAGVHFLTAMNRLDEAAQVAVDLLKDLGDRPNQEMLRARVAEIKRRILLLDK